MNYETIQKAIENGTLRKYDLRFAQVGDRVIEPTPGVVIAVYGEEVVIGWDLGDSKMVYVFSTKLDHGIYLAPLCWVEGKPVYKGDTLYSKHEGINKRVISHAEVLDNPERFRLVTVCGLWEPPEKLSWTDPTILFEVEGKPVRKGDVLYSPRGAVVKRVVSHVEPYESYDKEDNPVTALRVYGDDGLWDNPEKLTWTKPKIPIVINGFNVPEPVREPLTEYTEYFVPHLFDGGADNYEWVDDDVDHHFLRSGLVHLTEEAASAHAQALISLTKS